MPKDTTRPPLLRPSIPVGLLAAMLLGCGSTPSNAGISPTHVGASDALAESERHERNARDHEAQVRSEPLSDPAAPYRCADNALEGISYIGGESYKVMRPCWTGVSSPTEQHRADALRHRKAAASYRAKAEKLIAAEARHCAGLGEAEISRSPLTRSDDIVEVTELRERGRVVGAVIVVRRVTGLSAKWLRGSLTCHQARAAALGYPPKFMSDCPMTLPGTTVEVRDAGSRVQVRVQAENDTVAAVILARARDLVAPRVGR